VTQAIIVGCGAAKLGHRAAARDLYTGSLFRAARRHAEASGLPWRILSAKYGLIHPDQEIDPYDRKMASRLPFPFGRPKAVAYPRLLWGKATGSGGQWVRTGDTVEACDWRTPWWWTTLRDSLLRWLWQPKHEPWWRPADCLNTRRHDTVTVDIHAGADYVKAIRIVSQHHPVEVRAPLAGMVMGHRLRWYSQAIRDAQMGLEL
jgi:hypothetical protein